MQYLTDKKRTDGLGSSHSGTEHFLAQRLSAILLVPTLIAFLIFVAPLMGKDAATVQAAFSNYWISLIAVASFFLVGCHLVQGLQVVIEDYISPKALRVFLLAAMKGGIWLMVIAAIWSVLLMALS